MKKILLFSRDPGGSNAIIPLIPALKKYNYEVILFGKDVALTKYKQSNLEGKNILDFIKEVTPESIRIFIKEINPDIIITGTSADDFCEKYIWRAANDLNITSFAIVDQWLNYGIRFSKYSISESEQYLKSKLFEYLPSKIFIMDEIAKTEAIKEGLPQDKIIVTGQPYFETVINNADNVTDEQIKSLRDQLKIEKDGLLITFASEPITETYNSNQLVQNSYLGYTEITILEKLLDALSFLQNSSKKQINLLIRPHPKENLGKYQDLYQKFLQQKINCIISSEANSQTVIVASDIICGMSSMFLIESVILNKPTISVQIGLNKENPFILGRINILKTILDYEELVNCLSLLIQGKSGCNYHFKLVENPIENIISEIKTYYDK